MVASNDDSAIGPNDFKKFMMKNNIVITAAAITIGIASAAFIKSFVGSILMPSVYLVIGKIILQNLNNKLYKSVTDIFGDKVDFDFDSFIKDLVTWIFIVVAAYFIMDFVVRRWLLGPSNDDSHHIATAPAPAPALAYPVNLHNVDYPPAPQQMYATTLSSGYASL